MFRTIDYAQALHAVKLRRAPEAAGGEALFVQLAAHKPPADQFASRAERHRYLFWQLQRGIVAADYPGCPKSGRAGAILEVPNGSG